MEGKPEKPSTPNLERIRKLFTAKDESSDTDTTPREAREELRHVVAELSAVEKQASEKYHIDPSAVVHDEIEHDLGTSTTEEAKPAMANAVSEATRTEESAAGKAWREKLAANRPGGSTARARKTAPVPKAPEDAPSPDVTRAPVVEVAPAVPDPIPEHQDVAEAVPSTLHPDTQPEEGGEEPFTKQNPQLTVEEVDRESDEAREARQRALFERMQARNSELNKKAEELGSKVGKFVRYLGEGYGKMSLKRKFVVGVGLGISVITLAEVAPLVASASAVALGAQRVLGGLNVFVRLEKHLAAAAEGTSTSRIGKIEKYQEFWATMTEKQRTIAAAGLALAYTGLASYGVRKAVGVGGDAFEWLKVHYNYDYPGFIDMNATSTPAPVEEMPPLSSDVEHVATQPEALPPADEMPTIYADASPKGYEGMIKNIWQQLRDQNITAPADLDPNSDLAKLLNADEKTIGSVAHRIASDTEGGRGFFNEVTGESVRIDPQARLSIGADHQLHFSDPDHPDIIDATEKLAARTTPKFPPETPVTHTEAPTEPTDIQPDHAIIKNETITDDYASYGAETSDTGAVTPESIVNEHGLTVMTSEPHIYADEGAKHLFVYGGSAEEKAALVGEYFRDPAHAEDVVYSPDANNTHRIALRMVNGEVVAGTPVRTKGFLGFFSSFMEAAEPDEFRKIIQ